MTLEERVLRLERSCRRWRLAGITTIALAGSIAATSSTQPANLDHLSVQSLIVRASAGGPEVNISADKDHAQIRLTTGALASTAALSADAGSATLLLTRHGTSGDCAASVRSDDQSSTLLLRQADGKSKELEPE